MMKICDYCNGDTTEYGITSCRNCGEEKCVENCIPGGKYTSCLDCEFDDDDE